MPPIKDDESGDHLLDALLLTASGGDEGAMAKAFEHYRGRLERMVRVRLDPRLQARVDVHDVVQESYLEAARRLPDYLKERKLPFFLAGILYNLAGLAHARGRFAEALRPLNPTLGTSLVNVGELHAAQNLPTEAKALYRRAIAILEATVGTDHPTSRWVREHFEALE